MKKLILPFLILISLNSIGQAIKISGLPKNGNAADSAVVPATLNGVTVGVYGKDLSRNRIDSVVSQIALRIRYADSASMLIPYLRKTAGILATGGYIGLPQLSTSPGSAGTTTILYRDSSGGFAFRYPSGMIRVFRAVNPMTANRTIFLPDSTGTLALVEGTTSRILAGIGIRIDSTTYGGYPLFTFNAVNIPDSSLSTNINLLNTAQTVSAIKQYSADAQYLTGTQIKHYNTVDITTNVERFGGQWVSNAYEIGNHSSGTGTLRDLILGVASSTIASSGNYIRISANAPYLDINGSSNASGAMVNIGNMTMRGAGLQKGLAINPIINQTGSASTKILWISPHYTAPGSGTHFLIDAGTNSADNGAGTHTSLFSVDNSGNVKANQYNLASGDTAATKSYVRTQVATGGITGAPTIYLDDHTQHTFTGSTSETTLYTGTIPANTLTANGGLQIYWLASWTGTSGKLFKVRVGGTIVAQVTQTTSLSNNYVTQIYNRGALNVQIFPSTGGNIGFNITQGTTTGTSAIDFTASQNITITVTLTTGTDSGSLESVRVVGY